MKDLILFYIKAAISLCVGSLVLASIMALSAKSFLFWIKLK